MPDLKPRQSDHIVDHTPRDTNLLNTPELLTLPTPAAKYVTKNYHVGTTPEGPFHNVTVVVCFPERSDTLSPKVDGSYDRRTRDGDIVPLTDEQVEVIKTRLKKKVVRILQRPKYDEDGRCVQRATGLILNTDSPRYRPQQGDEPLAKYLYMRPMAEAPSLL